MGNNQSTSDMSCPSRRLCQILYLGTAPPSEDSGEWFGVLPKERKQKKKSFSQRNLTVMPVVPEETLTSASIDNGDSASLTPSDSANERDDLSNATPESIKEYNRWAMLLRQSSVPSSLKPRARKSRPKPKAKLTFVNGQFVDFSTEEGQDIVKTALSEEDESSIAVGGILSSVKSGHCGILGFDSRRSSFASFSRALSDITVTACISKTNNRSFYSRSHSSSSIASEKSMSPPESAPYSFSSASDSKNAVSSIVALGKGCLLTASICDRAIKMWNLTSVGGKITPRFCRDFPGSSSCCGHSTGITCVAKVDEKGRFLSASKDCVLKLWDSRFNCDDDSGDGDDRVLLATFDKITKRAIKHIAIIEDGKYVRPTDNVDMTMAITVVRKSLQDGSNSVQKSARERHIIECSCEFATISEKCKLVKLWSVIHAGQVEEEGGNVAELKKTHELKHDAVVQSITSMRGKGMILTGDSIGHVRLWQSGRNVFLPNSSYVWTCARTFSWRQNSYIMSVQENCLAAITALTFLHGIMFVSGSRSGILRVWTVDGTKSNGETITKEDICINGAHNLSVTAVRQVRSRDGNVSFSSASEDGKVLSFTIPISIDGDRIPRCFNVVNHGITNRYFPDPTHQVRVVSLCCLSDPDNLEDVLVTGTTNSDGFFHVLRPPKQGMQNDALVLHRQSIIDESLTMFDIAEKICNDVESKSRKLYLITYQGCFLGSEAVSYLVDHGYAASRKDAVDLGRVLASHLSLFECASKKGKLFVDDEKSYYRFSEAFLATPSSQRRRVSSEG